MVKTILSVLLCGGLPVLWCSFQVILAVSFQRNHLAGDETT